MKLSATQSAALRFATLVVVVAAIDAVYVWFAARPLPLAAIIPGLIPILVVPVVIMPMRKKKSEG